MNNVLIKKLVDNHIIEEKDIPIYNYSLFVIGFNVLSLLIAIVISMILNELTYGIYCLLFYVPIRILMGGYHCQTPKACIIFFEIFFTSILLIYKYSSLYFLEVISVLLFVVLFIDVLLHQRNKYSLFLLLIIVIDILLFIVNYDNFNMIPYAFLMNSILYMIGRIVKKEKHGA